MYTYTGLCSTTVHRVYTYTGLCSTTVHRVFTYTELYSTTVHRYTEEGGGVRGVSPGVLKIFYCSKPQ